jgi:hypothetical protein
MTLTVSPYLTAPPSGRSPQSAPDRTNAPQKSGEAPGDSAKDSISLSPGAQQALAAAPPDANETPSQSTLGKILAGIKNATGPILSFGSATNTSTGKNLDQSC